MDDVRPERGKSKSFRGVSSNNTSPGACSCQVWLLFVEAKICPTRKEPKPGQNRSSICEENYARYRICDQEYCREMFDSNLDNAFEDSNRVLGDELLEGDEEASLHGNRALDRDVPALLIRHWD